MHTLRSTLSPFTMLAVSCLLIAAPHAQEAAKTQQAPSEPAHKTMLLTGCLVAGPDASTFKLTRASEVGAPGSQKAVGTSGSVDEYELRAEARLDTASVAPVDMKALVGHQVEVTVRPVEETPDSASQQAAGAPTVAPDPGTAVERKTERFSVTAIKQVRPTCS
jgi:hypothetical protein